MADKAKNIPKTHRFNPEIYDDVRDIAAAAGITLTAYINAALMEKNAQCLKDPEIRTAFEKARAKRLEEKRQPTNNEYSPIARRILGLDPS